MSFKGVNNCSLKKLVYKVHRRPENETLLFLGHTLLLMGHNDCSKSFDSKPKRILITEMPWGLIRISQLTSYMVLKFIKNTAADADKISDKRSIIFLRLSETYFERRKTMWELSGNL